MGIKKYKYYFKKPRSEITKDVLTTLATTGLIIIAAQSPYFVRALLRNIKKFIKYPPKRVSTVFHRLKKQGVINIERKGTQFYMSLTEEGRKLAGIYQINHLKIKKLKKWDRKWRLVIFDIAELKKMLRELFRGKLKELGFQPLQKSIWIYPYDCQAEIEILRDFFGLSQEELRLIVTNSIGNDSKFRKVFSL